ncbi:hypothetical protein MB46_16625 [Arthrobacter alpinus]|uniref:DUF2079 domain-containing protein n=1 Tax=Arthrobacter alpinus TaxID=656366 RepID=UPI000679AF45|nr:DUF2079 domain-containing protein [Arthrobacter alpinus]ALV46870.1 hypothetical protein MB46_16625 [Arthrobacter alpinus]
MTTEQKPKPLASSAPTGSARLADFRHAATTPLALAGIVGVLALSVYSLFSWLQWRSFAIRSWDLGIFTQLAKDYAKLQPPIVSIKGDGYNLLGDHFHPLLVLLAPIYRLFPSAYTLLVVQNLLLAISVVVICHFATKRLGPITGACLGAAYALSWGLQSAIDSQFHEVAFAVPLLALSLVALLEERWRSAWIWASLLVFIKEDLGLTVFVIGLVMAWRARTAAGLWLSAWGVTWFVLATKVILPAMNPGDQWAYQSQLNISGLLSNPASLFQADKVTTVILLAVITAGLCLFSPLTLIVLPTLAWRFLSDLPVYWGQEWQYSAVLMPVVFAAAIDALCRRKVLNSARLRLLLGTSILLMSVVLTSQYAFGKLSDTDKFFPLTAAESSHNALAAVPDGVTVETDISLMSYLVDRTEVYWIGNSNNPAPQYVLIDISARPGTAPTAVATEAAKRFPGATYITVFADARYQVAQKR